MRKPSIRPVVWKPPKPPARARHRHSTEPFPSTKLVRLPGDGPEDVVVDAEGQVLTGVEDGRILRVSPDGRTVHTMADTGGRPLGLHVCEDGNVLVCDAVRGLLRLDPGTSVLETLADVRFASNAVAATDGTIYFTSSSARFGFEHWLADILEHSGTGRLLRRAPGGTVTTLLDGLQFANGVVLSPDESALVVAETGAYRLIRYDLRTGKRETLVDNLPGSPDNMSLAPDGLIWVAMPIARNPLLDFLFRTPPLVRQALWALPEHLHPQPSRTRWVIAVGHDGRVVRDLQRPGGEFSFVTGVAQHDDRLYLGSLSGPYLAITGPLR